MGNQLLSMPLRPSVCCAPAAQVLARLAWPAAPGNTWTGVAASKVSWDVAMVSAFA